MASLFEEMGGTYRQAGDYLLPNVETPENPTIGIWGQRRRRYLQEHRKALYTAMLLSGDLNAHLEAIDQDAAQMFDQLMRQCAATEGVTEERKAKDQLAWVQQMNNIRHRAAEIVCAELIYN